MPSDAVYRTELPGLRLLARGKVRDVYDLGDALLLVATDRLSAFDCVFPDPIPDKGRVLNQIAAFWFARTRALVPNHVIATDAASFPPALAAHAGALSGRATLAKKLRMLPIECVARGYLAGSGWQEYRARGTVCGIPLPAGLKESQQLPEPIFTPATKAESGHDENIPFEDAARRIGADTAERVRALTLALYTEGARYAASRGLLLADTKFEFGFDGDTLLAADEMLTPDSSRYWPAEGYRPGGPQPSFDKQFVRDYVETLGWDKKPPAPPLPPSIVEGLRHRYLELFRRLTGQDPSP
ncbi:MAG TPA: phosphoribosylaminoimidazolesuccinocarboxamide synthase [Candidatus Polarisedimenticolaceae bacterium]|nr:phosphoribosylaminoimidazolesuccinocarboxamide synthase [Candidatus Polarisedimenticolaceae bacterium]